MKIIEIAFAGYTVSDVPKARKFYEGVLGLETASVFEQEGMAFIEYGIGKNKEHTLVIGKGAPHMKSGPAGGATVTLEVDDFEDAVKTLKKHKVHFVMEPTNTGACKMTLIEDPDKNLIMIHKRNSK